MEKIKKYYTEGIELIVLILIFLVIYQCAILGIDGYHDGTVFNTAMDVIHGKKLFSQTRTQYGILTVYLQVFSIRLLGEKIWSLRVLSVLFYTLSFGMYYMIFKRIMPKALVIGSQVILLLCAPFWITTFHSWASVYALFFMLCAMKAFMCYLDTGKKHWMLLCAMAVSLGFWCRQPVGMVLVLAVLLCLIGMRLFAKGQYSVRNGLLCAGLGFILVCIPFFVFLTVQGTWKEWWNTSIGDAFRFIVFKSALPTASVTALPDQMLAATGMGAKLKHILSAALHALKTLYRSLFPFHDADDFTISSGIFLFLPIANLYVFIKEFAGLCRNRKTACLDRAEISEKILVSSMCIFALSSWHQYYPVSDVRHWYWGGFPMMGILVYMVYRFVKAANQKRIIALTLCAVFVLGAGTIHERFVAYKNTRRPTYTKELDTEITPYLEGLKLSDEQITFFTTFVEIKDLIRESYPDTYFNNSSFCGILTAICDNDLVEQREYTVHVSSLEYPELLEQGYYLYAAIDQNYREQELAEYENTIYIYLPDTMILK